jgi:hypothetical protein
VTWTYLGRPNSARRVAVADLEFLIIALMWGGWGSNPRPSDYEKYGLMLRVH